MAGRTSANFGVRATGMRITAVTKGSNADALGLLPGDLVESVNGRVIPDGVPLVDLLETIDSGTRITLKVQRDAAALELAGTFEPKSVVNTMSMFPRTRSSGRVDLVRDGNTVRATTRGVAAFTLLLSPDVFDFTKPITVVVDGRTVFDGLGDEGRRDADAMGGARQRSDDAVRRRAADLSSLTRSPAGSPRSVAA